MDSDGTRANYQSDANLENIVDVDTIKQDISDRKKRIKEKERDADVKSAMPNKTLQTLTTYRQYLIDLIETYEQTRDSDLPKFKRSANELVRMVGLEPIFKSRAGSSYSGPDELFMKTEYVLDQLSGQVKQFEAVRIDSDKKADALHDILLEIGSQRRDLVTLITQYRSQMPTIPLDERSKIQGQLKAYEIELSSIDLATLKYDTAYHLSVNNANSCAQPINDILNSINTQRDLLRVIVSSQDDSNGVEFLMNESLITGYKGIVRVLDRYITILEHKDSNRSTMQADFNRKLGRIVDDNREIIDNPALYRPRDDLTTSSSNAVSILRYHESLDTKPQ